jgi:putative ubiquitin-RnfH superfamily antitoxin RatB of RatAB toxin-antitoxin module
MDEINVQVAYALPGEATLIGVRLPAGASVREAIERSGILAKHPEIDLAQSKVGIYSKLVKLDAGLHDRDRIEIYRPLIADPKEMRRQRAAEGKVMRKGA